jgi:hypothetical protein
MIFKKRKILNLGHYLYGIKNQILVIDCDKLLFLKKYKNIYNIIHLKINDKRIYYLIYMLLKYRVYTIKKHFHYIKINYKKKKKI